jgi:hypothetical protein
VVFERPNRLFGGEVPSGKSQASGGLLSPKECEEIGGTKRTPPRGYEAALERNIEAQRAVGHRVGELRGTLAALQKPTLSLRFN